MPKIQSLELATFGIIILLEKPWSVLDVNTVWLLQIQEETDGVDGAYEQVDR